MDFDSEAGQQAGTLAAQGLFEEAERLALQAVEGADATDDRIRQASARMDLAEILRLEGKGLEAATLIEGAATLYESAGDRLGADRAREALEDIRARPNPGPERTHG